MGVILYQLSISSVRIEWHEECFSPFAVLYYYYDVCFQSVCIQLYCSYLLSLSALYFPAVILFL